MLSVAKSENMRIFEKCMMAIEGKEIVPMSISVYHCWKLFQLKYNDVPSWKKSPTQHKPWLCELAALEEAFLTQEAQHALPYGTAYGIHMSILFYKALALNESTQTINAMADYMEKLNKIGYQVSQHTHLHHAVAQYVSANSGTHHASRNNPRLPNQHAAGVALAHKAPVHH